MRCLVIAVVVAAGACFVGGLGASAAPTNGQTISKRRTDKQRYQGLGRLRPRLAS
jgi:hypothetical protein